MAKINEFTAGSPAGSDLLLFDKAGVGYSASIDDIVDASSLKGNLDDLQRLESDITSIVLVHNSAWDDSKEKPTAVDIQNYTRSKLLLYNKDAKLYAPRYYNTIYFDENKNKLGVGYEQYKSPYQNTKYICFTWGTIVNDDVFYRTNFKENVEESIKVLNDTVEEHNQKISRLESDLVNLVLVKGSAWDDSKEKPTTADVKNATRSEVILYNESASLYGTNIQYQTIFYDSSYTKQGVKYNSVLSDYQDTKYIVLTFYGLVDSKVFYRNNDLSRRIEEHIADHSNPHKIALASLTSSGLMSPQDKQKLQNMQTEISISGSGVTKNASSFGFLPTNDGITNADNLQTCLNGGGTILIDVGGVYDITKTLYVESNTTIIFGAGVYIRRSKGADGKFARHLFVNRGALTREYDENISMYGLKILTSDISGGTYDISEIAVGLRGLVSFFYVKNLMIDGFEMIAHDFPDYAIQICTFENSVCRNIHIEIAKDGVHYGRGRKFVLENCTFLTDDDPIALNAVDFPGSNAEMGNIEDGIIRNITLLSANGTTFHQKRGMLIYAGAWKDWESGGTYRKYGDCVVSNGRMYQSVGELGVSTGISTVAPNHTGGAQTYSDGFTWLMKQESDICYSATVRNITFENMYIYRKCTDIFQIASTISDYHRPIYPGSNIKPVENITFKNVNVLGEASNNMFYIDTPIDNIKLENCKFAPLLNLFMKIGKVDGVPMGNTINMAMIGNIYNFDVPFAWFDSDDVNVPKIKLSVCGSMTKDGFSLSFHRVNKEILNTDISVN